MKRWAPILWLPVYIASELILLGSHHRWSLLAAGGALALIAFLSSLWLALHGDDSPRPRWFFWAIGGVALCYVPPAVAAGSLGVTWAVGALAAAIIPMTAVSLTLAVIRAKTRVTPEGVRDVSGDAGDPAPGIGMDDETPLGDTDQHSDVVERHEAGESPPRVRSR
jgi:hypothetical protein